MPKFDVLVVDDSGELTLSILAESEAEARVTGAQRGEVVQVSQALDVGRTRRLSSEDRQLLLEKLATLLEARVGMGRALRLIRDQFDGRIQEVANMLLQHLEGGADLCSAMTAIGERDFPVALVSLLRSGISAKGTVAALEEASRFESELSELRRVSAKGVGAAASGFIAAAILIGVSVLWAGPALMESPLIKMSKVDVGWAFIVGNVLGGALLLASLGLGGLVFIATILKRVHPEDADSATMRVPVWRHVALGREAFLGWFSLAELLKSGTPLDVALRSAGENLPKGRFAKTLKSAAAAVERGEQWAEVFVDLESTDRVALGSAIGREQLASLLSRLALAAKRRYVQKTESFVMGLQLAAALSLSAGGALLFVVSILPMLMASRNLL